MITNEQVTIRLFYFIC